MRNTRIVYLGVGLLVGCFWGAKAFSLCVPSRLSRWQPSTTTTTTTSLLQASFPSLLPTVTATTSSLVVEISDAFLDVTNAVIQGDTPIAEQTLSRLPSKVTVRDYEFNKECQSLKDWKRRLTLQRHVQQRPEDSFQERGWTLVDRVVVSSTALSSDPPKVGLWLQQTGTGRRALVILRLLESSRDDATAISSSLSTLSLQVEWFQEPPMERKNGQDKLNLLQTVSQVLDALPNNQQTKEKPSKSNSAGNMESLSVVERYYQAFNNRDFDTAIKLFSETAIYDDTAFRDPLNGRTAIANHLQLCGQALPSSFDFCVDDLFQSDNRIVAQWHVENNGQELPFTKGCSYYQIETSGGGFNNWWTNTPKDERIRLGIDFVEATGPIKSGGIELFTTTLQQQLSREPQRWLPLTVWIAYMVIVFFSDGILPGANALQLEARTWQEVLDLSLNFFLVAPLLHLPFSPSVHPMLEGVFNLLLSWAAMFAGFLSDDDRLASNNTRQYKQNVLPMIPIVVGMQFLTSAFLLPYLATRSSEDATTSDLPLTKQDVGTVAQVCESPALGGAMGLVGILSIGWGLWARASEYGSDILGTRWNSFMELLSIDRVGSSFLVDLAIFAVFQGWLVNDDWQRRRGVTVAEETNANYQSLLFVARYVPFFGMAAYLLFRPSLVDSTEESVTR